MLFGGLALGALLAIALRLAALARARALVAEANSTALREQVAQRERAQAALAAAYERLRRSEAALAFAQRIARIGSWELVLDESGIGGNVLACSHETHRIFGHETGEAALTPDLYFSHVHPDDLDSVREQFEQGLAALRPFRFEHRIVRAGGNVRHLHVESDFIHGDDGRALVAVGTVHDITERKAAEQLLRDALESLESRNRELQDFAFVASHDLQEPLRKIQAFGDRLAASAALEEQGRDWLQRMQHAAARMQVLIDDLLTYSRVATRSEPFVPVDLGAIAREVLTDLEAAIERSGATVEVAALPVVQADATQMRQLLQNLLSNSLKFRAPERAPRVRISAQRATRMDPSAEPSDERVWRLSVSDNGIGFDMRHRERILQPFQRLHGRSEYPGTGIGLAIVRRIVERHHGTIEVDARAGEGATFTIELPAERTGCSPVTARDTRLHETESP